MIRKLKKSDIPVCIGIAKGLPEWFDKKGILEITKDLASLPTFVYEDRVLLGYACIKIESMRIIEIKQLAVKRNYQGHGVGKAILKYIEEEIAPGKTIIVKTLDESCDYEPYVRTRAFYIKNGFKKTRVIDPYPGWDPGNPCAIYTKTIKKI